MTKVSIIVPNYNHAPFLAQRLDSILNQTFQDYELLLLDDGSTDGSQDIIHAYQAKHPHIKVLINDLNSGNPFRQWDCGVRQAQGEYVWIAESDDYADINFLMEMVPILEENQNIGLAYCGSLSIDEQNKPLASISGNAAFCESRTMNDYFNDGNNEIKNYIGINNTINNASSVLFRKASYIDAGFADHEMRYCGDWFLYLRMLLTTDIAYNAKVLNFLRLHTGSSCHEYYTNNIYLAEVIRIYNFVMQNVAMPSKSKKRIYDQLSLHCCMAIRKKFVPSKQVIHDIKRIVPCLEFYVLWFLAGKVTKKVYQKIYSAFPAQLFR
jgi:glycosyltransferase involved in cell wall biosynthesis